MERKLTKTYTQEEIDKIGRITTDCTPMKELTAEEQIKEYENQIKELEVKIKVIKEEKHKKLISKIAELASMKNEFGRKLYTYSEIGSKVGKSAAYVGKIIKKHS